MADYTIEQWLIGMVDFYVPQATIAAILYNNQVAANTSMTNVPEQKRDLCLADLYMWVADSSTSTSGETESDGGWSRTRAAKKVENRIALRLKAKELYQKWNSSKADSIQGSTVIKDLY